jgi:hypothetical protein
MEDKKRWSDTYFENMSEYDAIEIGALDGTTTRYLSKFFKRVFVIDPWDGRQQGVPSKYEIFLNNTKDLNNVYHCRTGSETELARKFLSDVENPNFGFAYIDGLHTTEAVINDFDLCKDYIKNNKYIFIDDCDYNPVNVGAEMVINQNSENYVECESSNRSLSIWNESITYLRIFKRK